MFVCLQTGLFASGSFQWVGLLNGWVFSMGESSQWVSLLNGWVFSMDRSSQWVSLPNG